MRTPSNDPSSTRTPQAATTFNQTTLVCRECRKELPSLTIKSSQCERVPASSWLWEAAAGYTCGQCQASLCNECWQKHNVRFSLWSRWKNSVCHQCHQPFAPGLVFVPQEKAALLRETLDDLAKPPFTGCRSDAKWTARGLSLPLILMFSIVMVRAVFSGDYPGKSDMITGLLALFPLLVAWRWEMVGGGLMLLGTSFNAYITRMQEEPLGVLHRLDAGVPVSHFRLAQDSAQPHCGPESDQSGKGSGSGFRDSRPGLPWGLLWFEGV